MTSSRKADPSDVSDEEWALVAPSLTLLREDARAQSARGVQRAARRREDGCAVTLDARRPAAVGRGLPAGPKLAGGRVLRATGRRSAANQARLRPLATALGGGALLRLSDARSPPRQRRRALSQHWQTSTSSPSSVRCSNRPHNAQPVHDSLKKGCCYNGREIFFS